MECNYIIDNTDEFLSSVKTNRKNLTKEQLYRESVEKWEKCLRSNKNNRYAERLMKAVENMNKAMNDLLVAKSNNKNNLSN